MVLLDEKEIAKLDII